MPFWKWSQTAASNATADSTINWAEGQAPSTVNDSARAMMAAQAKWLADVNGTLTTAGSATAYTLSTNSVYDSLAHMDGALISFLPHITNNDNVVATLAVDGLTAQPIWSVSAVTIDIGQLVANCPVMVRYSAADAAFSLINGSVARTQRVPVGSIMALATTSLPTGWLWCDGAAASRTEFFNLFNAIGTQYGAGNGTTTFNVPNLINNILSGNTAIPSTAGGVGTTGKLTNTSGVGLSIAPSQVNWMIKY